MNSITEDVNWDWWFMDPSSTPHFPETNTQKKSGTNMHRHPGTYTKKMPFKPTETQRPRVTRGFPNTHTPICTRKLSHASRPALKHTQASIHRVSTLTVRHMMTEEKHQTTDSFFHLLGLGWGSSSLGAGCWKPKFRKQTEAQLSH